ncbi:TetR/AcrR family transcriptional regulator [Cryptosporangium arvum]|uniref:TetR/AcrR family transcriptional regulator n=1 Tax=Cryptosporangium arvum TaxID=80871 RepID=UPI0004BBAFCA|nr:TetR/AcrR family transcriptional regulator [Cryptosporangium arvum]
MTTDVSPRRRPSRRGEGERLKGEIVAAAAALLQETGDLSTLSLRAVARKVGIATTSIYLHFEDLHALVRAVKNHWLDMLVEEVEAAATTAGLDPWARVRAIAHAYVDAGMNDPARYQVLFQSELVRMPPGDTYLGSRAYDTVLERVRQAVPPDVDANMLTVQFWCSLHGTVMLRQSRPNFPWPDLNGQVDDLVDRLSPHGV